MLTAISWNGAATGGSWDLPTNWSPQQVPTTADTVTINLTSAGTVTLDGTDQADSLTTNANTTLSVTGGSLSLGSSVATIDGPMTVATNAALNLSGTLLQGTGSITVAGSGQFNPSAGSILALTGPITLDSFAKMSAGSFTLATGSALTIGANVPVVVSTNQTLTDNGAMTLSAGDSVNLSGDYGTGQFVINGTLTANSTLFANGGATSQLVVDSGGELTASNSTFNYNNVILNPGSILMPGDLSNNAFNTSLSVPYADVALLSQAEGGSNNLSFEAINIEPSTVPSGQTLALNAIGTATTASLQYIFPSGFTVAPGATLTVGPNVPVVVSTNQTLTDNGAMTLSAGDSVNLSGDYGTGQFVINGTLTANSTLFANGGATSQLVVDSGGELTASNSTFNYNNVILNPGSILMPGDLSNNAFNTSLSVPYADVALLSQAEGGSNNLSFEAINIEPSTVPSGQTLALNAIGTATTASLQYIFPSGFTVAPGATLTVGPNVPVVVSTNQTLTDNGAMTLSAGDSVNLSGDYGTGQFVINGTLTANSTLFANGGATSQLVVDSGGELTASNSTFNYNNVILNPGSILMPGDLSNNAFNTSLSVPYADVALLSQAEGGSNNLSFEAINIEPSTVPSGQTLALNAIGTATTASLQYIFPSGFTVAPGATLTVGPNVPVVVSTNQTLTDNGAMTLSAGDSVNLSGDYGTGQFVINGTLTANSTLFANGGATSQLVVDSGGELTASNSTFNYNNVILNPGSILMPGDLSNNAFNTSLSVPYADVALLSQAEGGSNNLSFEAINIEPSTVPSGQTLALNAIGTATTASLQYIFPSGFTVAPGATLTVGPNVPVVVSTNQTLTDNGAMTLSAGDSVNLSGDYGTGQFVINGTLTANSTLFANGGATSQLVVDSGGELTASNSTFNYNNVILNPGSSATLSTDVLSTVLTINSAATVNIAGNDFSNIGAQGVVAVGDPSATIPLTDNYWGTTVITGISAKILDHTTDATRPTINFQPFINNASGTLAASKTVPFSDSDQTFSLTATINSSTTGGVAVNEGTETFTILDGNQVVGNPTTPVNVSNGAASASYTLPGGTVAGVYTIEAVYSDPGGNFLGATDTSQLLTVGTASTGVSTPSAATTFSASTTQSIPLTASVTSGAGNINEGIVTFTVLNYGTPIGTAVVGNVTDGSASATYTLPIDTPGGSYTIQAVYSDPGSFATSTGTNTLTVSGVATTTTASDSSATFSPNGQNVILTANVTSNVGLVSGGTVAFTVDNGTTQVGNTTYGTVNADGTATATYTLPGGSGVGPYTITATYGGTSSFLTSTDNTHQLTVNQAPAATAAAPATTVFAAAGKTVNLTASVTSAAGVVNAGQETFTILEPDGITPVGTAVTVTVSAGVAHASYTLPVNTLAGTYIIQAVYDGTSNFLGYTDTSQTLTIGAAASATSIASSVATYNAAGETVNLSANVFSGAVAINEGTETFTLLEPDGITPLGTSVTVNVIDGVAAAPYLVPAGTLAGTYIIQAVYNGTSDYASFTNDNQFVTINAAASATAAASASVSFNGAIGESFPLSATVTSAAGTVSEGTETFTILENGVTPIGTSVTVNVLNGEASGTYVLPVGTPGGTYIIQAVYNGGNDFFGVTDTSQTVTVSAAASVTAAASASASFSIGGDAVPLSATVTGAAGVVNEGTETFTILNGATPIGTAVTVNVVNGVANASYLLPAGVLPGTYIIQAVYNGTADYATDTDSTQVLTISAAATVSAAATATATFDASGLSANLTADVTSTAGVIGTGTETFTILNGTTPVGTAVTVNVVNGVANASYPLAAGTLAGTYNIQAVYNPTSDFSTSTDSTHYLVISAAASVTSASAASTAYNASGETANLTATVTSAAGTVNEGSVTFTILNGTTVIGTAVTVNVSDGAANTSYSLPAGTLGGTYIIQAVFNPSNDFSTSTDNTERLTISAAGGTITSATAASTTFSASAGRVVPLSATVTSAAGTVTGGTETFTILNGATPIGTAVTNNVVNGAVSANYTLPAGTPGGTYTIQAVYNGSGNFGTTTDSTQQLVVGAAATTTSAAAASAAFNDLSGSTVNLTASVNSAVGTVNEGTETFTILNGAAPIGTAVTVNVNNGVAAASYLLPAGTLAGTYIIQAVYNPTSDFSTSTDSTHFLTIAPASSSTSAAAASTPFNASGETADLTVNVTSAAGTVNEGSVTFTILNGTAIIGTAVTVDVSNGAASTTYTLPAGTAAGSYTIQAVYNSANDFSTSTDSTHHLTITAPASTTSATAVTTTFSAAAETVNLTATVTSAAGTVNEGSVTFTILNGTATVGTAVTVNVAGGVASATYQLPAGTPGGSYTIQAVYNGTSDFATSTDSTRQLTVSSAAGTTAAASASATYSGNAQTVNLTATVTSAAGTVNTGTVIFTILNGATVIGTAATANVVNGLATAGYLLPAGTPGGSYTIQAVSNASTDFQGSTDSSKTLTIGAAGATTSTTAVSTSYNAAGESVNLTATVASAAGTVNGGTETFTILNGTTPVGTPVTVNVVGGAASASYTLPPNTATGPYTIRDNYTGTSSFQNATDQSKLLTISAAASATAATAVSTTYSAGAQSVNLTADVTSAAGTVNEGTVTFTLLNGATQVGSSVTVNVSAGSASAGYLVPANTSAGTYIIQATYNDTGNFGASTDNTHDLAISAASSVTNAVAASATFSTVSQSAALSATVTSAAGVVTGGTETFTLLNGTTPVGTSVTANVLNGLASTSYTLPAGLLSGPYTIQAVYSGSTDFLGATDSTQSLTVNPPPFASVPLAPQLTAGSDSGVSGTDGITKDNGSAAAPLSFVISGLNPPNAYVRLFDVTNPGSPVLLGVPTLASQGTATITLAGAPLTDGLHEIAVTAAPSATGTQSSLSATTAVTIQSSLTVTGTNPSNGAVVNALPDGQVTITFNHALAGLTSGGPALSAADPYGIFLLQRGPSLAFSAPSGVDSGDLPLHANTIYQLNSNGTSTITITPEEPLSSDLYDISITLSDFKDLAGNTLTDPNNGNENFLLQLPPTTAAALQVVGVTTHQGTTTVNGNAISQPDTFAIAFNQPLWQGAANSNTVQIIANPATNPTVVTSVATYNPSTDSIYLTPTAKLYPGTQYVIRVDGSVSNDQGYSGPGPNTLGGVYYDSFTVTNQPAGAGTSPLEVVTGSNGSPNVTPANQQLVTTPLGYASAQFTEPLNMAPTAFTRFSAMLDPRAVGSDNNLILENIPLNAQVAFNPNTDQLIMVPTQLVANGNYVLALSNMQAVNGDPLLNAAGQKAGVNGGPIYTSFAVQAGTISAAAVSEGPVVPITTVASLTTPSTTSSAAVTTPTPTTRRAHPSRASAGARVTIKSIRPQRRPPVTASRWPAGPLGLG